jgi:hypothetical protein
MDPASGEAVGVCVLVPLVVPLPVVPLLGNGRGTPVPVESKTRVVADKVLRVDEADSVAMTPAKEATAKKTMEKRILLVYLFGGVAWIGMVLTNDESLFKGFLKT